MFFRRPLKKPKMASVRRFVCGPLLRFTILPRRIHYRMDKTYGTFCGKHCNLQTCPACLSRQNNKYSPSNLHPMNSAPLSTLSARTSFSTSKQIRCQRKISTNYMKEAFTLQNSYKLVEEEFSTLAEDIKKLTSSDKLELQNIAHYHLDGHGKSIRPMTVMLMAKACNYHHSYDDSILYPQRVIAMISEMIHTASLIHDDVIDMSDIRRGKPTVKALWGERKAILAGNFILSQASSALANLQNEYVVTVISGVIEDLVKGEFMQLGSKEDENERFNHYLKKTFKKTASLIANSCKAVAILGDCCEDVIDIAYNYGRNIGLTFQLIDDILDFVSCDKIMGKPTTADLKLGLATAPVLFAAQEYPELHPMIMRRFSQIGDVRRARDLVAKSDGVTQARILAEQHAKEAVRMIQQLKTSSSQQALIHLVKFILDRKK